MKKRILKDWVAELLLVYEFILLSLGASISDEVSTGIAFFIAFIIIVLSFINFIILTKYTRLFK